MNEFRVSAAAGDAAEWGWMYVGRVCKIRVNPVKSEAHVLRLCDMNANERIVGLKAAHEYGVHVCI